GDQGLVGLLIARRQGDVMDIDTLLLSCRVIGRTVEAELLAHLSHIAQQMGCTRLRGVYIPSERNAMVQKLFSQFGFEPINSITQREDGATLWQYDLANNGLIQNGFIKTTTIVQDGSASIDAA